jgi:hypothetical protein
LEESVRSPSTYCIWVRCSQDDSLETIIILQGQAREGKFTSDIFIRIRICESIPLTNESGSSSGSCSFRHWPSRRQQKICFAIYFLKVHLFTSFFKGKKSLWSHKTVEIKFFMTTFAWWWKNPDHDSDQDLYLTREAQKLTDPDSEHWNLQ